MFFAFSIARASGLPISGTRVSLSRMRFLLPYHDALARRCLNYSDSAPTFLEMDISLSLSTTISRVCPLPASFIAS